MAFHVFIWVIAPHSPVFVCCNLWSLQWMSHASCISWLLHRVRLHCHTLLLLTLTFALFFQISSISAQVFWCVNSGKKYTSKRRSLMLFLLIGHCIDLQWGWGMKNIIIFTHISKTIKSHIHVLSIDSNVKKVHCVLETEINLYLKPPCLRTCHTPRWKQPVGSRVRVRVNPNTHTVPIVLTSSFSTSEQFETCYYHIHIWHRGFIHYMFVK